MNKKTLQEKAFAALKKAVKGVIQEHKLTGRPLSVWRDGKVLKISAEEAMRNRRTH